MPKMKGKNGSRHHHGGVSVTTSLWSSDDGVTLPVPYTVHGGDAFALHPQTGLTIHVAYGKLTGQTQ